MFSNAMRNFKLQSIIHIAGLVLGSALAVSGASAQSTENWRQTAEQLIAQPMRVTWNNQGSSSNINLVEIRDGFLAFTVVGQTGEAALPIDSLGESWFNHPENSEYNKAIGLLEQETFNLRHLDLIKQVAYPMVRFLDIPEQNCQFRSVVNNLVIGLIQLNQFDEAIFLFDRLDISKLGPEFEEQIIRLAKALVDQEEIDKAITVIKKVPIKTIDLSNTDLVFQLAHALREKENYVDAQDLYTKLSKNLSIETKEAEYWSYYCQLYQEQLIDDHDFATNADKIKPGKANFPLQQLVLGIYYSKREQSKEAMRAISQGIAFATPVEPWTAELMFRSGKAYEEFEMNDVSKSVFEETMRFFPASKWAEFAQQELNKPQPIIE